MHNTLKFWSIKFMDANFFIILFMIDLYKDNHMCACVCVVKLFLSQTSQKLLTGFLPNFTGMFLRQVYNVSTPLQKNQACGAIQALKHLQIKFGPV